MNELEIAKQCAELSQSLDVSTLEVCAKYSDEIYANTAIFKWPSLLACFSIGIIFGIFLKGLGE